MSELNEKIAQYLAGDRLAVVTGKLPAEGWATRCADGILALLNQQPITAETVRQAAHDLLCWTYQHCINVDPSEYSRNVKDLHPGVFNLMNESERVLYSALLKDNEAIAQRANQGVSHEG